MIDKVITKDYTYSYKLTDLNVFTYNPTAFVLPLGKNWHRNNKEKYLPGYHPQAAVLRYIDRYSGNVKQALELDFSLPKLLYDNNLYELRNADRNQVYQTLQSKLQAMAISMSIADIRKLDVCYVEYSKNIYTGDKPIPYILQELYRAKPPTSYMDVEKIVYANGGETLSFWCKGYSIVFYDKGREVQKELGHSLVIKESAVYQLFDVKKIPPNILRMEVRFHNRATLKNFLADKKLVPAHRLAQGVYLEDIFSEQISQYVLQYYWNNLKQNARQVSPFIFSPEYELFNIHKHSPPRKRSGTQMELAKLGLRCLLQHLGYNGTKWVLELIVCSNPATYLRTYIGRECKPYRKLDVFAFISGALTRFSCLSRRKWLRLKPKASGPWYYRGEQLLTEQQASEWLNIPVKCVSKLIQAGKLVAKQIGNVYRIRREDILAYLSA